MDFNPRPREGDDSYRRDDKGQILISIHVPARGTTHIDSELRDLKSISIHVPARGTTDIATVQDKIGEFQSTSPRGGRLQRGAEVWPDGYFNPRPREGDDSLSAQGGAKYDISIHVPARGTTLLRR